MATLYMEHMYVHMYNKHFPMHDTQTNRIISALIHTYVHSRITYIRETIRLYFYHHIHRLCIFRLCLQVWFWSQIVLSICTCLFCFIFPLCCKSNQHNKTVIIISVLKFPKLFFQWQRLFLEEHAHKNIY